MSEHEQVVQRQFGEQASAYLNSAVHAQGAEFALLQAAVAGRSAVMRSSAVIGRRGVIG